MTSEEAAARIQASLGPTWQRNRPIPDDVLAPLCEAMWQEGVSPNRRLVQRLLPGWNEHALGPGVVAWRKSKGLPQQGVRAARALPTSPSELAKIISTPISRAPHTCFDPTNDGRWLIPSVPVLLTLARSITSRFVTPWPCSRCYALTGSNTRSRTRSRTLRTSCAGS